MKTESKRNIVHKVTSSNAAREPQPQVVTSHDAPVTRSYQYCSLMVSKCTPSRQIKKFSGESLDYHRFMVDFDNHVFCRISDYAVKLGYLINLCTGRAHDAIDHCGFMLPAQEGYRFARKLLKSRFGQEMQVERRPSRMDTIPNIHNPEWTPFRMDTIPNKHLYIVAEVLYTYA